MSNPDERLDCIDEYIAKLDTENAMLRQQNAALISQAMTMDGQNIALNADYELVKKELCEARKEIENYRHRIIHGQIGRP